MKEHTTIYKICQNHQNLNLNKPHQKLYKIKLYQFFQQINSMGKNKSKTKAYCFRQYIQYKIIRKRKLENDYYKNAFYGSKVVKKKEEEGGRRKIRMGHIKASAVW